GTSSTCRPGDAGGPRGPRRARSPGQAGGPSDAGGTGGTRRASATRGASSAGGPGGPRITRRTLSGQLVPVRTAVHPVTASVVSDCDPGLAVMGHHIVHGVVRGAVLPLLTEQYAHSSRGAGGPGLPGVAGGPDVASGTGGPGGARRARRT